MKRVIHIIMLCILLGSQLHLLKIFSEILLYTHSKLFEISVEVRCKKIGNYSYYNVWYATEPYLPVLYAELGTCLVSVAYVIYLLARKIKSLFQDLKNLSRET